MINIWEVNETNKMVEQENLDVRTITIGISLLECIDSDLKKLNENIYNRITTVAKDLAAVGEKIENEYGIPIVNKRISVTPIALVGGAACKTPEDFATIADTLDRAAKAVGANLIGGYSALVSKGMTKADSLDSDGTLPDRACLQFGEPCIHEDRHQYGCSQADGRDPLRACRAVKRPRFCGLHEACCIL